ncbi:hypothetical protein Goshw_015138 [Gossypium schwendimanii]|uniref:HMA domain-containing protein n=1 Tax=Gossypium schwendimanii TaxID=34291 RepID=A0A7J9KLF5_GOSSC|nr:hypothetical protein [Gossypium schwendimanii]
MKGMHLFCVSLAFIATCSCLDHRSMVRHGHRSIDPQKSKPYSPYSSQLPIILTTRNKSVKPSDVRRKSSAHIHDLTNPLTSGSMRYLLNDRPFIDCLLDSDHVSAKPKHVVVLRVSIHCKGCEGKVRKQISKMEGVASFSIDLATKKVTVIGDVTPSSVLASVSKVKNAQIWSSPSASPPWSNQLQIKITRIPNLLNVISNNAIRICSWYGVTGLDPALMPSTSSNEDFRDKPLESNRP